MERKVQYFIAYLAIFTGILFLELYWSNLFPVESWEKEIDPEYFSGLLGASSIIIVFSTWVLTKEEKNVELKTLFFLITPLILFGLSVGRVLRVATGTENAFASLHWLAMTLIISLFTLVSVVITRHMKALS